MLNCVDFDASAGVVHVHAELGPDVRIAVDRINADIVMTDEVVSYKKRVGGFERRWKHSDAEPRRPLAALRPLVSRIAKRRR